MRVFLELIRIICIFGFVGSISAAFLQKIYTTLGVNTDQFGWLGSIAILVLLFVLYRNKLQFGGWYIGKGKVKLSKKVTNLLLSCSILLLVMLPLVSYIFN